MPTVKFADAHGTVRTVEAECGMSLMEVARINGIPGIDADCGGVCACATCHIYVDDAFLLKVGPRGDCEEPLLEFVEDLRDNSRLACQIQVTDALEGLGVTTPLTQK